MRTALALLLTAIAAAALAWDPVPVAKDSVVFLPGSQPGSAVLEHSTRCDNCHGGYAPAHEPAHNWRGSMMAHASRDPLWLAAATAAMQDSVWQLGNPNGADICVRCHVPVGWLGDRSDPVNGTRFVGSDFDGVTCDFCHRMVDPMHALRQPDVPAETAGQGATQADRTFTADGTVLQALRLFDGTNYFDTLRSLPRHYGDGSLPGYVEATSGHFVVGGAANKRGPQSSTNAMHAWYYSRFHRSRNFCGTCHDVSNGPMANALVAAGTSERRAPSTYFHQERTFSEFLASAYGRGGAPANPKIGVAFVSTCQDCHLRKVTGRPSIFPGAAREMGLHDLTGGNSWIPGILASADMTSPSFDPYNHAILSGAKYPGAKVDVGGVQGHGAALLAGRDRALAQLRMAADLKVRSAGEGIIILAVVNNTGHKLISGFPEGRRMWLNVKFFGGGGEIVSEINPYEPLETRLDGLGNEVYVSGGDLVRTHEELIWEAKMQSIPAEESDTLRFLLATGRSKDNRIPPKGFDVSVAAERLALPVWNGVDAPDYFTAEEYERGEDEVTIAVPPGTSRWRAVLYYQTTSKAYVEFLRDEINGTATALRSPTPSGEAAAYIAQTDPFFASVRDWGRAIWDLWLHNGGSPPVAMATSEPRRRPVARGGS
jgi:hypothetical protein